MPPNQNLSGETHLELKEFPFVKSRYSYLNPEDSTF